MLTAEHCTASSRMSIMTGTVLRDDANAKRYPIKTYHHHHLPYQPTPDIAIAELEEPIKLNGETKAIPLASVSDVKRFHEGTKFNVSGWGDLYDGSGGGSDILQWVEVPWVPLDVCREAYSNTGYGHVEKDEICAGDLVNGGVDSCQGDSGGKCLECAFILVFLSSLVFFSGPLTWRDPSTGTDKLVGVVSWGLGQLQTFSFQISILVITILCKK